MKKLYIAVIAFLVISIPSHSQSVDKALAGRVGLNFVSEKAALTGSKSSITTGSIDAVDFEGSTAYYAVNLLPEGFVLVSASQKSYPVIGYSFEGDFNVTKISPAQKLWLETASQNILEMENTSNSTAHLPLWNKYSSAQFAVPQSAGNQKQVLPLNNIKWNQNSPYNYYCPAHPEGPGGRCYAGCVATGMGMIMKYWNYPASGHGSKTYFWGSYYTVHFDSTEYAWDDMTNTINNNSRDAIATLLFHCGLAVNMNYGPAASGSSMTTAANALKMNFGFIPTLELEHKTSFTDYDWKFILKQEIDFERPVFYSGNNSSYEGHAFVVDGYQDTMFWHFNWGWGGYSNGYYNLNYTDPNTMSFYLNQAAIIGMMPPTSPFCDDIEYTQGHWVIDDGSGYSYYQNNRSCQWLIEPELGGPVSLNFISFDTEAGQDVLYIYDGANASAPLIGTYSGNQVPSPIISTGSSLFLRFETNGSVQKQGWKASYQSLAVSVPEIVESTTLRVYPNPAKQDFNLEFFSSGAQEFDISILDISGRELQHFTYVSIPGTNTLPISTGSLSSGIYYVTMQSYGTRNTRKIVLR